MAGNGKLIDIPHFSYPDFLDRPPTGQTHFDVIPIISMAACFPTLAIFWAKRRIADLVLYSAGFVVAVIYHTLHLHAHQGLDATSFLGVSGADWRTLDIISANLLLARTMGHALGVDHPLIAMIPNAALPAAITTALACLPGTDLRLVSRLTCGAMAATAVLAVAADGGTAVAAHCAARYTARGALRAGVSIALGLFSFAMPSRQPSAYWAWHSAWHLFMGLGYYELYAALEGVSWRLPPWVGGALWGGSGSGGGGSSGGRRSSGGEGGSRQGLRRAVRAAREGVEGLRGPGGEPAADPAAAASPVRGRSMSRGAGEVSPGKRGASTGGGRSVSRGRGRSGSRRGQASPASPARGGAGEASAASAGAARRRQRRKSSAGSQ